LANAYIYGDLDFGGVHRKVLAYPQGDQARAKGLENSQVFRCGGDSKDIEIPQALVPVGFKSCLLAGELDILKFKESLIHSTFVLQLHTDDLCERVFTAAHVNAYNKINAHSVVSSPREEATPIGRHVNACERHSGCRIIVEVMSYGMMWCLVSPRDKKPPAKAAKGAAPVVEAPPSMVKPGAGAISDSDKMVLEWIETALSDSSRIKSHGTMRFRLEHLLESATDKLMEFQKTRTGKDIHDLNVVVSVSSSW
jgi:hypothetical protein